MGNKPAITTITTKKTPRRRTDEQILYILRELERYNPQYFQSLVDDRYIFFKLSGDDMDTEELGNTWTPFKDDENLYLEHCYRIFTKDENAKRPQIGDYIINFVKWYQYKKEDENNHTRLVRADPYNIDNVYRLRRLNNILFENKKQDVHIQDVQITEVSRDTKTIGRHEIIVQNYHISKEIDFKYTYMEFKVIPGHEIKFRILNIFKENIDYKLDEMKLDQLKINLINELELYYDSIWELNTYKLKYLNELEENNFYKNIIKMCYSQEIGRAHV